MSKVYKAYSPHESSSNSKLIGLKPVLPTKNLSNQEADQEENLQHLKKQAEEFLNQAEKKLREAQSQAEQLIEQAQQEITEKKNAWQEEKQSLIVQAKNQGYDEGFASGKKEAHENYQELLTQAHQIIEKSKTDYMKTIEDSEDVILRLGIKAAEKILHHTLTEQPLQFLSIVKSLLNEIKEQPYISLYIHPNNYDLVIEQKEELQNILAANAELTIFPKEGISTTSCYAESPFGRVDASIDSQLSELRKKLFDLLEGAKANGHQSNS